jgi:formylmethanofuran dehydrogenase subunit E-like metal-binding protein
MADSAVMQELGSKAAKTAMQELKVENGDANVLVLTSAGHAIVDGQTTQAAIKGLTAESGNSVGDGNLFQVLRPHWKPVWFYFFDKATGEAVFMQADSQALNKSSEEFAALPDDQVFSKVSKANVNLEYMLNHTEEGNATFDDKAFAGNEFSLVGMSNVWAEPGATFDFLQSAAFHDHLCPGVTSGYMLAKFVENKMPINNITTESYKVIACPQWCKDDLLQMRWDATPGKSGMFVMALTDTEKKALNAKYNQSDVAGIYIRWNDTAKEGDAMVLGFNWTRARELDGSAGFVGPSWAPKLIEDVRLMEYWDQPELVVSIIKEFKVDAGTLAQMQNAGMHPLKVAGVL